MKLLERDGDTVEVESTTWADILLFLANNGWEPGVPFHPFLGSNIRVSDEIAESLAAAGNIVLEEVLNDPLSAHSIIKFDLGKLAEIVDFASEGAFVIRK